MAELNPSTSQPSNQADNLFAIDRGEVSQNTAGLTSGSPINQISSVGGSTLTDNQTNKKLKTDNPSDDEEGLEPENAEANGSKAAADDDDDDDIFVLDDDDDEEDPDSAKQDSNVDGTVSNNATEAQTQQQNAVSISVSNNNMKPQHSIAPVPPGSQNAMSTSNTVVPAVPPPPPPPPSTAVSHPPRVHTTGAMFQGTGPLNLPDGVTLPPSITPELMSDRLREMLYQLPPETMRDAFQEYDNAVTVKGHTIRSHQAYLHGVLKRYVQLIGGDVKNLTKDPLPGRNGGNASLGSYGPAAATSQNFGQFGRGSDGRGPPPGPAMIGAIAPSKTEFSPEVNDRLRMVVARGFCTEDDLRDDRVRSKLLALSDKDALNSIDELLGVDPAIIRSFSSYFLGIVNRYARGEGRAQREEARRKRGGLESSDRRRGDRDRDRRNRSHSRSPDYHRGRGRSRSRSPDYHRSSRSRRYRDSSRSRSPEYRRGRRQGRDYEDEDYHRGNGSRGRRERDRHSRSTSPSDRDRRRRDDRYSSSASKRHSNSSRFTPDEKTRAAAAQALNSAFNSAFTPGQPQAQTPAVQGMPLGPGFAMAQQQGQMQGQMGFPSQQPSYQARPGQQPVWQGGAAPHNIPGQYLTPHQQAAYAAANGPGAPGNSAFDILGLAEKAAEAVKLLGGATGTGAGTQGIMAGGALPGAASFGQPQPPLPPPRHQTFPAGMQQYLPQQQQQQPQAPASGADLPVTIQYALQNLMASGHIDGPGIDPGLLRFINLLPEQSCLEALQTLSAIDISKIRNKNGYLAGILKKQLSALNIPY